MRKCKIAASVLVLLSIAGCASTSQHPAPKTTPDAVRELTVALAGQCKASEVAQGTDFKACFNSQLDTAVEQIRRYQQCVTPVGCEPNSGH